LFELYDDRYGYSGLFQLNLCPKCGHRALCANISSEELIILYSKYYQRASLPIEQFRPPSVITGYKAWLDGKKHSAYLWVPENVRVLDIGCGFGETLAYHKTRGCDVYGVEADENIRRVAEKFGFNVHVGLFDPDIYPPNFFDYVTLDQVIEHVTDPQATMRGIASILKPGGIAIISTPNANGWGARLFGRLWINWHAPYHLHHFSCKSMQIAAEASGLKLEQVSNITCSEWIYYQWLHLMTYPKMEEPSQFWSPKRRRSFWVKLRFAICACLHRTKIDHLITRLFDTIGFGDNYLFFLRKL
jgi:SAM-dependent methyltransferase